MSLLVAGTVLLSGCASEQVEGIRVPLNTGRIVPVSDSAAEAAADAAATEASDSIAAVVVPVATDAPASATTSSVVPSGSTTPGDPTSTASDSIAASDAPTTDATLQTNGLYDCGNDPADLLVFLFLRFNANGEFFLSSGTETLDETRKWLGTDLARIPAGAYTGGGSVFAADTDPGADPGIVVSGQISNEGILSIHTKNELTLAENDFSCTFSPD